MERKKTGRKPEPKVAVLCFTCAVRFTKEPSEHRRRLAKGQERFYCSRTCMAKTTNSLFPRGNGVENLDAGNRRDSYTEFRWFIARARAKTKRRDPQEILLGTRRHEMDITVEHLKSLWTQQNGLCALSGVSLILPDSTQGWSTGSSPSNASLDRVDNHVGYLQGNVRFVSVIANLARSVFTDEQLIQFCRAVAHRHGALSDSCLSSMQRALPAAQG